MESHHDSLKTLGRTLRYRRWNRKMSMKKLADKSGVCYRSVIAYEHGLAKPSMRNLLKLCKVLDLQVTLTPSEDIDKLEY